MNKQFSFSRRSKWLAIVVSVALTLTVAGMVLASVMGVLFDSFSGTEQDLHVEAVGGVGTLIVSSTLADVGILGGSRDVTLQLTSSDSSIDVKVNSPSTSPDRFAFSAATLALGKAQIKWDGSSTGPATLDPIGLQSAGVGEDLTLNGARGIHLYVMGDDNPVTITIKIYTDATDWGYTTYRLPGGIYAADGGKSFYFPFNAFIAGAGTLNVANVGAVVFDLDATIVDSTDVTFELLESTGLDLGDLPTIYGTNLAANGPRHIIDDLHMGTRIDAEDNGQGNAAATGDDTNSSGIGTLPTDEDGVVRTPDVKWTSATGGSIDVTVNGCTTTNCYLNGWIDWQANSDFSGTGAQILTNHAVTNGLQTITFAIPTGVIADGTNNTQYYARFRLCSSNVDVTPVSGLPEPHSCNSTGGQTTGGEVEDYRWGFGPNAITLDGLEAKAGAQNNTAVLILAASVVAALGLAGVAIRRRRTA